MSDSKCECMLVAAKGIPKGVAGGPGTDTSFEGELSLLAAVSPSNL